MKGKLGLLHVLGWILIGAGIVFWVTGVWFGPGLFVSGLVIETIGYLVADRGTPSNPEKEVRGKVEGPERADSG